MRVMVIYRNNDRADINMTVFADRLRDAERERQREKEREKERPVPGKTGESRGEREVTL